MKSQREESNFCELQNATAEGDIAPAFPIRISQDW